MKRLAALMALVLIAALLCPVCALAEGGMVDVRIDVSYETGMARAMLDMINDFRCGSNAWQWNSDNRTKTVVTGLKPLKYDEGLESIAMRRAAELASYYSHTRPNGKDPFSFGQKGNLGENIACGYNAYTTTKDMFEGWLEENVSYMYQGHRRNMLDKHFSYIGIGCVKMSDRWGDYYFWTQEFSSKPAGFTLSNPSPIVVETSLAILEGDGAVLVKPLTERMEIVIGESAALPEISALSGWGNPITLVNPAWIAGNDSVTIGGGQVTGVAAGASSLSFSMNGEKVTVQIKVTDSSHTHTIVTDPAVPPTATQTGLTEGSHCETCGEVIVPQEVVPALGDDDEPETPAQADATFVLEDGVYRVYRNGAFDGSYNGLVTFEGETFLAVGGALCTDANGLMLVGGEWYFLTGGRLVKEHTGFAMYDGEWFLIRNGRLNTKASGLYDYDGESFLISVGRLVSEYSGLWQNSDGRWLFIADGQLVNYTGLVMYDEMWFFVKNGKLADGFTGEVQYGGETFNVVNGVLVNPDDM